MKKDTWSKATPHEKSVKLQERWEDLKRKREPFLSKWRDVSNYISPFSGRFDVHNHGEDRDLGFICDEEATHDLNILTAGLISGASSPARPWFKISPNSPSALEDYSAIDWCSKVQNLLLQVFMKSDTYSVLHQIYRDLALFGISADLIYDDYDTAIRHHFLSAGEFCVETNSQNQVDTLYRNFELTVIQAIKFFGYDKLPREIQDCYRKGNLGQYFEFLHCIEPRIDRDYKSATNENFAWASYYLCIGCNEPAILKESGFDYFPAVVPRWDILGGDAYGTSPAIACLPSVRQLQQEAYCKAQLLEQLVQPPLQVPNNARQNVVSLSAGALNFTQNTSPEQTIKPIVQGTGDIQAITMDIEQIRQSIKRSFFVDLFMMVQQTAGDRRTTVEIYALQQEQMLSLGPVVERMQNELLGRLVNITFKRLLDAKSLPPAPQSLGKGFDVEFTSVLAQSQKSVDINGIDRFISAVSAVAQVKPEVLDRVNPDGFIDEYRDRLGVAPKILFSKEDADKMRQQRQQQQQAQQQQEQENMNAQNQNYMAQAQKSGAEASQVMQGLDEVGGGGLF